MTKNCTKLFEENLQLKEEVKSLQEIIRELKDHTIETYYNSKQCYTTSFT